MEEILHQLTFSVSRYLYGFNHPRWCRISSIHSIYHKPNIYWSYLHQLRESELGHRLVSVMVRYKPVFFRLSPAIFLFIDMIFIDFPRYYPYILPTFSPCNIIPHLITIRSQLIYLLPKDLLPLCSIYIYTHNI